MEILGEKCDLPLLLLVQNFHDHSLLARSALQWGKGRGRGEGEGEGEGEEKAKVRQREGS